MGTYKDISFHILKFKFSTCKKNMIVFRNLYNYACTFGCRYTKCDGFIRDLDEGKLQTQPGCSEEETLEVKISFTLVNT